MGDTCFNRPVEPSCEPAGHGVYLLKSMILEMSGSPATRVAMVAVHNDSARFVLGFNELRDVVVADVLGSRDVALQIGAHISNVDKCGVACLESSQGFSGVEFVNLHKSWYPNK